MKRFKYLNNVNIYDCMSETITVNVEEEVANEFREEASRRYGKKKGYLGKAVTEALSEWNKKRNVDLENEVRQMLKVGIKGKKWKFNREELYDR